MSDGRFEVVDAADRGYELRLRDGESVDFESEASIVIDVEAGDGHGNYLQERFEVAVEDIEESTAVASASAYRFADAISAGYEQDSHLVYLEAGRTYDVDLYGVDADGTHLSDPYFRGVYGPDGSFLGHANDDWHGYDSHTSITAAEDGVYRLVAGAYGSNTGAYRLDVVARDGGAASAAFSHRFSEAIDRSGETDDHFVFLVAGRRYGVDLYGVDADGTHLSDPYFRGVYGPDETFLGHQNDDSNGLDSHANFTATESGVYRLVAGAYGSYTGAYELSVYEM